MRPLKQISLFTHSLDAEQRAQVERAVAQFNDTQSAIAIISRGEHRLPTYNGKIDVPHVFVQPDPREPEVTATGLPFSDNWFTRTTGWRGILNVIDWQMAFLSKDMWFPPAAPDAYLLASFALITLLMMMRARDLDIVHERTTGCICDLCAYKPDRAIKMRAAFICPSCRDRASAAGVSTIELDAVQAVLERVRVLALGRTPQTDIPDDPSEREDRFFSTAELPPGTNLPGRLRAACREQQLTVLVGSGMSLQHDVQVSYPPQKKLPWDRLPTWSEVPQRLADSLTRYRDRCFQPRPAQTLNEFLADLDYFKSALGDKAYYPRAIFDIFTPNIHSPGLANRMLFRLPLRWLLTTNYDFVLNYAAPAGTAVFTWREARQAREYLNGGCALPPLLKLHGCASRPDTIVLTQSDYHQLRQCDEYLSLTRAVFESQVVLFVGFGLSDPLDLDLALQQAEFAGAAQGEKFALMPRDRAGLVAEKFPNVNMIPYSRHEDVSAMLAVLGREKGSPGPAQPAAAPNGAMIP